MCGGKPTISFHPHRPSSYRNIEERSVCAERRTYKMASRKTDCTNRGLERYGVRESKSRDEFTEESLGIVRQSSSRVLCSLSE